MIEKIKNNNDHDKIVQLQAIYRGTADRRRVDRIKQAQLNDQFDKGSLEINAENYNNPQVLVRYQLHIRVILVNPERVACIQLGHAAG